MSKPDEKVVFCQVDAHLDTNPKIRKAGRDGRDIFEFLLRRVAIGRTNGTVPLKYVEPWYLADQLMMSEPEAINGIERARTARLIDIDHVIGVVRIVGWSEEWGRKPKDGATRTREYRLRQAAVTDVTSRDGVSSQVTDDSGLPNSDQSRPQNGNSPTNEHSASNKNESSKTAKLNTPVTDCDDVSSHVTVGDESDVGEEKRGDKKRGQGSLPLAPKSHPDRQRVIAAFHQRFEAAYQAKPTWDAKSRGQLGDLLKKHPAAELEARMDFMFSGKATWPPPPYSLDVFVKHIDRWVSVGFAQQQAPARRVVKEIE